jgi:hypothetical protein
VNAAHRAIEAERRGDPFLFTGFVTVALVNIHEASVIHRIRLHAETPAPNHTMAIPTIHGSRMRGTDDPDEICRTQVAGDS